MIIPAILEKTPQCFAEKIAKIQTIKGVKHEVQTIQVDFIDGQFLDHETLSIHDFAEIGDLSPKYKWEAHLMILNPQNFADYQTAGFSNIIVHYEAFENEEDLEEALDKIQKLGLTPAIAINPETPVTVLRYFTDTIHNFTLLSVHPGKQGNPFIQETYERVKELREIAHDAIIEVDGGVNANNAKALLEAGADNLVVGSALFETENTKKNYQEIESSGITI